MKFARLIPIAVGATLCAGPSLAEFKQIMTEAEFRQHIVGKKITFSNGTWWTATPGGKLKGEFARGEMRGTWKWSGHYFCRSGTIGGKDIGNDCQIWEVDGKKIRYTRGWGKGKTIVFSFR